jgi:hypothetical protein
MAQYLGEIFIAVQLYLLLGSLNIKMQNCTEALTYYGGLLNITK